MADSPLHSLTAKTAPVSTDEFYGVSSPFGAGDDFRTTGANLGKALSAVGKLTVTQPATSATLTVADGKTLTVNDSTTLGTGGIVLANSGGLTASASAVLTVSASATVNGGTHSGTNTGDQTLPTRASLGLDTTDSPQFAGLNIGAASDTTVTRTGAGDIAVEGNAIYRAGGTDVPVTDGGTGASTALGARQNLGLSENNLFKQVRAATTANITISTALNNGDSLDGLTLATGDRVLVKDQSTATENGIYIVGASPSRAVDYDSDVEIRRSITLVQEGTVNAGRMYYNSNTSAITVDTTGITFQTGVQTSGDTASVTPNVDTDESVVVTGLAQAITINNFTGTPSNNQRLWISITGTAARAISWGTNYESSTVTLPTTTVTTARLDIGLVYNSATSKFRCVGTA